MSGEGPYPLFYAEKAENWFLGYNFLSIDASTDIIASVYHNSTMARRMEVNSSL